LRSHHGPDAGGDETYVELFKLFADAYHTWHGSYHYTPIRGLFRLAASRLQNAPHASDHDLVVEGLNKLCEMLLAYTRCENSIINNDPFALKDYSQTAINLEEAGLSRLHDFSSPESYLEDIADWLRGYLEKNRYLHTGLNACAQIYAHIMRDRGCPEILFHEQIRRAEEALDKLTQISPELSSELNAHIRHTREHYLRLAVKSPTFLRVRSGKLVLSLTAAC